ncbi:MAG: nucleotidyltransferase family protein [Candidatus Omnitrophota bacterium]
MNDTYAHISSLLLKQALEGNRTMSFLVISDSMSPLIKYGDTVIVAQASKNNLSSADIVLYQSGDKIIVHRFLYWLDEQRLCIKADIGWKTDRPVAKENLIAKVITIERKNIKIDLRQKKWKSVNNIFNQISLKQAYLKEAEFLQKPLYQFSNFLRPLIILFIHPNYFMLGLRKKIILEDETKFILLASQPILNQADKIALENLAQLELNWNYIIEQIKQQKIASLSYRNIKDLYELEDHILNSLKNIVLQTENNNKNSFPGFQAIIEGINKNNTEVIVLGDAILANSIYPDKTSRSSQNIKLIINKESWPSCKNTLEKLGFYPKKKPLYSERFSPAGEYEYLYYTDDKGRSVKIEFNLFCFEFITNIKIDQFLANKTTVSTDQINFSSLPPEEHLLYLLAILIMYDYKRILGFLDIYYFIIAHQNNLNWDKFAQKSKETKLLVASYYGLLFTKSLFGSLIPEEILRSIKPNSLQRKLFALFYNLDSIASPEFKRKSLSIEIKMLLAGKLSIWPGDILRLIRWAAKIIFPTKEYMKNRYQLNVAKGYQVYFLYAYRLWKPLIEIFLVRFRRIF